MTKRQSFLLTGAAIALLSTVACGQQGAAPAGEQSGSETQTAEAGETESDRLLAMVDRHAALVLQEAPEFATSLGVSEEIAGEGYDARLGSYGFEGNQRMRELNEQFLEDIRSIDRDALNGQDVITYDVVRDAYETGAQRNQFEFGGASPWGSASPYPVTQLTGAHLSLPRLLMTQHPLETKADAENYLSRLSEFARVFDELIESLGADAALGVVPPYFALEGAAGSIESFVTPLPAENPMTTTFVEKLSSIEGLTEAERDELRDRAVVLVETSVYPAYGRLKAALENLVPQAGQDAGVWRLGQAGEVFYQHALNSFGASGMTGEEVHELGLSEVARIQAEIEAILEAEGISRGQIRQDPNMFYPNTDEGRAELLDGLNAQVDEVMAIAPDWFGTIPSQSVEVRRIPVYEQDTSPGGYYTAPPIDGSRPGIYWINLKNTGNWIKPSLKTLTYHEAVPGHHFQISLERAAGLPLIRSMFGYSEFSEGWALYAEQVAVEMGMYEDDPLGNVGRLQAELFRAARLVVDSGLHAKQWTREQAIEYLTSNVGSAPGPATREIERYAVWPGQACAYKLGMLKINEMREKAEAELGDKFDIKEFHDEVLLTGSMPLPVLERKINAWIAEKNGE